MLSDIYDMKAGETLWHVQLPTNNKTFRHFEAIFPSNVIRFIQKTNFVSSLIWLISGNVRKKWHFNYFKTLGGGVIFLWLKVFVSNFHPYRHKSEQLWIVYLPFHLRIFCRLFFIVLDSNLMSYKTVQFHPDYKYPIVHTH